MAKKADKKNLDVDFVISNKKTYFMNQRTWMGVDKVLEDSSQSEELDKEAEEQIDRMLDERVVEEREDKIEARKQSILAKRRVLKIKATDKTIVDDKEPRNKSQGSSKASK